MFYTSPYFGVGGIIAIMLGIFTLFPLTHISMIYIIASYLIYLLGALLIFYLFPKLSHIYKTIMAHIFFILGQTVLIIVMSFSINTITPELQKELWTTSAILQLFVFLSWLLMIYISRIYQKTQLINIQVTHSYHHFIATNYAYYAVNDFIANNNIQYAYVICFSIKGIKKNKYNIGERTIEILKQHFANQIDTFFAPFPDKLLFMSESGHFCALVKADVSITKNLKLMYQNNFLKKRGNDDLLLQFESFQIKPYEFQSVKIVPQTNLLVGLYGVHNNDIFNLIHDLQDMVE
jgi:hypothetical protein